ncbi:MAG: RHS repeat-associated core domain-containing protein, partial [Gemmatimonadetes bacterium]|nr:RHS repeat-associated core domain-containing protein [Gemmatimonadota bacterium]
IGREWDDAAGLLYLRARYYDPEIGRFISEDPIGLQGGVNPYAYASNDPVNRADRTGLVDEEGEVCEESDELSEDEGEACEDDDGDGGSVFVACIQIGGVLPVQHCAIKVETAEGEEFIFELIPQDGKSITSSADNWIGEGPLSRQGIYDGRWVRVPTPSHVGRFDVAVLVNAQLVGADYLARGYSLWGSGNSNSYVYTVIRQSGGQVPASAGRWAPGLCGGAGLATGLNCAGSSDPFSRRFGETP